MPIITLTSDLGIGSPYVAAMKGVIYSIDPGATVVDISHSLPFLDVVRGGQLLLDATPWFPADTIHVAVVDPGGGTARPIFYARIGTQQYIASDNGLLGRLMAAQRPSLVLRLTQREFWLPEVAPTFHGRDIMAPVAVRLSLGLDPRQLGPVAVEVHHGTVNEKTCGEVMAIDSFGNLITNILYGQVADKLNDTRVFIGSGIYETYGIYTTYGGHAPGELVALIGSSGRLELIVVADNAGERTGLSIGTPVVVARGNQNGG